MQKPKFGASHVTPDEAREISAITKACIAKLSSGQDTDIIDDVGRGIVVEGNSLFFHASIERETILDFRRKLERMRLIHVGISGSLPATERLPILLHINSDGGSLFDAVAGMDAILRIKKEVPIYTIVEGWAASGGTLLSVVGTKRFISPHSLMLIHQVHWTNEQLQSYEGVKDYKTNADKCMELVRAVYREHTKVPEKRLTEILKHDIIFTVEECLEYGLVDALWE